MTTPPAPRTCPTPADAYAAGEQDGTRDEPSESLAAALAARLTFIRRAHEQKDGRPAA